MGETRCIKIKLKSGSAARARAWGAEIMGRRDEALATLRDEGVVAESVFLDSTDEGDFLIYYMKAESFERAGAALRASPHAIDAYHKEFMDDTWEAKTRLELLVDLDCITEP